MVGWALKEESLLDFCLDKYNSKQLAGPVKGQTNRWDGGHGWKVNQCKDTEMKMHFRFLLPIMHPKAPSYVPLRIGNTIIKAWKKGAPINWAKVLVWVIG